MDERYGTRTREVERRIEQFRTLTHDQYATLELVWETVLEKTWQPAYRAARRAASGGKPLDWENVERARREVGRISAPVSAREAAADACLGEMFAGVLTEEHYQTLVTPLELVTAPPAWWTQPDVRSLFFEMLREGNDASTASAAVTALV